MRDGKNEATNERTREPGEDGTMGGEIDGTGGSDAAASRTCMRARAESSVCHWFDAYVYAHVCVSSDKSRMAYTVVFKGFDS
jgi:hypothetical protein